MQTLLIQKTKKYDLITPKRKFNKFHQHMK